MPVLLALLTLYFPRLLLVYLKFFTRWFQASPIGWVWLILGFVFAPFTLLWYSAVWTWFGGRWDLLQKVVLVIAVVIDLSGGFRAMRKRK